MTTCDACNCPTTGGYDTNAGTSGENSHINAFLTLNGMPYLVAEYIDNRAFSQVERELVKSELIVDNSDCTRTIIDISIDDIGKDSVGNLNTIGNTTKQNDLVDIVKSMAHHIHHKLPVIRKGIVVRVNYQLENQRTGIVMRSMVEDLRIFDRNYFLDINPDKLSDTALISNYSNSIVSTVAQFTHGTDPMILRITNIQLLYECVEPMGCVPRVSDSVVTDPSLSQYLYGCNYDVYHMHQYLQHQYKFTSDMCSGNTLGEICPPTWDMFSRFYHFDSEHKDAVLHDQEIYDAHTNILPIACGHVQINRAFVINPGTRIIWKINIWKNDVIMVSNCSDVAAALGCPLTGGSSSGSGSGSTDGSTSNPNCNCGDGTTSNTYPPTNNGTCGCTPDSSNQSCVDKQQSDAINKLSNRVDKLINVIAEMHPDNKELGQLKFESNVTGDPIAALIDRVDRIAKHLDVLEGKIDDTVDTDYITTLVSEVQSALEGNPPVYGTVEVIGDNGLSKIESDTIGNTYVYYQNKNMIYVDKSDEGSPDPNISGWWAVIRIKAPESLTIESDFANCKMRGRNTDESWKEVNFWAQQDSNKDQYACQRYIDFYVLVDPARLDAAVYKKEPLQYIIQVDWNGNSTYENNIYVNIHPGKVLLFDKGDNLVWPRVC